MKGTKLKRDTAKPFGELYVDTQGEPHFICHTADTDFEGTKKVLIQYVSLLKQFAALIQGKIDRGIGCPYYKENGK